MCGDSLRAKVAKDVSAQRVSEEVESEPLLSAPSRVAGHPCDSVGNLQTIGMQLAFICLLAGKSTVEAQCTLDAMFALS